MSQIIQIVQNGVGVNGCTVGDGAGGNTDGPMLTLDMTTAIPSSASKSAYKIFLSGSASNQYTNMNVWQEGSPNQNNFIANFQNNPQWLGSIDAGLNNIKGAVQQSLQQGGSGIATNNYISPDNLLVCSGDLTNNTVYYVGWTDQGNVFTFKNPSINLWLYYYPISELPA
jgi:hypothetical protein